MKLPKIAITMGDPSGVGPEIIVGAYKNGLNNLNCIPIVIGQKDYLYSSSIIKKYKINVETIKSPDEVNAIDNNVIYCIDINMPSEDIKYGVNSIHGGEFSYQCVKKAVDFALKKQVSAICTGPISKISLHKAGYTYPGHTEMLADLTNSKEVSLMLMTPILNVAHVTAHMGLIDAIENIDDGLVFRTIQRSKKLIQKIIKKEPAIGVCAINPHAGENKAFGRGEEEIKITPAIKKCLELGWNVKGPLAADALFYSAAKGGFDLIIAMYHDQGHGPVKVLGIEHGVNVTIGLPIIRTSVDHGTAFDIAGKGIADETNLLNAIKKAVLLIDKVT